MSFDGGAEGIHCGYEVGLAHLSHVTDYEQGISAFRQYVRTLS
jgi:hypothetical protein